MGKKIDAADQDQIIDWAGVGDDQPHGLKTKFREGTAFFLKIFKRVFLKDVMLLERAIQLNPAEIKHNAELHFGNATGPEFLEAEILERAT